MKELTIENLHKTYGTKTLLAGIDFMIRTGDRVGLIGPNGTGKSSFLKVIAGLDNYDDGLIKHPNQYSIAYLDQNPEFDEVKSILETVYDSNAPQIQLVLNYENIRIELEADPMNERLQTNFTRITDEMNAKEGWDVEVRARTILSQLGLNDLSRSIASCSGGERKRIGIAQVLIAEPDLLILDEPTNHLDVQSIQWLEKYLATYKGALLLVTHDRYFLERVVNKIIELKHGHLTAYEGNYETYLEKKADLEAQTARHQEKQDSLFKSELAWMRKGAKARTTKQQARIERFNDLKQNIQKRDVDADGFQFEFEQQRIGSRIMELEEVSVKIADINVIDNFTKSFVKGERIGIIGENGVGKSTLMNTLAGLHPIASGTYEIGQTVRLAYYRQLDQDLPGETRVLSYLTKIADDFPMPDGTKANASQLLEQFNFPRVTHGQEIKHLSGGERRRLYLLSLLVQQPNVLILDEPTNDLDIDTLTVLEDYVDRFEGVVLIVSHDRYFLDKTVDQLLELTGNGQFELSWGNYSDYLAKQDQLAAQQKAAVVEKPVEKITQVENTEKAKRMTYQEKKEWATILDDIEKAEQRIEGIQTEMNSITSDAVRLIELQEELDSLDEALLNYYERYEYLSELSE
ncbi:ABC-F family ATP-binding cassette domain-containing protein [Fundicoccus ignavus]|uniref:ATP-binding cassette domain-containing protein n=1 Tax=Fundicoccus ignavus TaxID=2664442 RepID=A0A844C5N0_9LACT|nr:ABC-F family ATP-binding cassette domain-containing protein [Fundicoccus ignavus]MRI80426.1 ATP-binding cassette domain-containing protein [Fundicoccus ignavus]MRJ48362.1 ATP-binding cassette domain-containing protein [Fundicoccus ignavus]